MLLHIKALALFSLFTYTAATTSCAPNQGTNPVPVDCLRAFNNFFGPEPSTRIHVGKAAPQSCSKCQVVFQSSAHPAPSGFDITYLEAKAAFDELQSKCPNQYGSSQVGTSTTYLHFNRANAAPCN